MPQPAASLSTARLDDNDPVGVPVRETPVDLLDVAPLVCAAVDPCFLPVLKLLIARIEAGCDPAGSTDQIGQIEASDTVWRTRCHGVWRPCPTKVAFNGLTAVHVACLAAGGDLAAVEFLLERFEGCEAWRSSSAMTLAMCAALGGASNIPTLLYLLERGRLRADVSSAAHMSPTPVPDPIRPQPTVALLAGHPWVVAEIFKQNARGNRLGSYAAFSASVGMLKAVADLGGDREAVSTATNGHGRTPLDLLAGCGDLEVLAAALDTWPDTPLESLAFAAVRFLQPATVRWLVEQRGADYAGVDGAGNTLFDVLAGQLDNEPRFGDLYLDLLGCEGGVAAASAGSNPKGRPSYLVAVGSVDLAFNRRLFDFFPPTLDMLVKIARTNRVDVLREALRSDRGEIATRLRWHLETSAELRENLVNTALRAGATDVIKVLVDDWNFCLPEFSHSDRFLVFAIRSGYG